jgi:VCBS repeat-containing protein
MYNTYSTKKTIANLLSLMAISTSLTAAGHWETPSIDIAASDAPFNWVHGLTCDSSNNLYVTEWAGHRVRKVTFDAGHKATVSTFATPTFRWNNLSGVAVGKDGAIYVANTNDRNILKITPQDGKISVFAKGDFDIPSRITRDSSGNLYVTDHNLIRKIDMSTSTPTVSTIAGGLAGPQGIAINREGKTIYVAEQNTKKIQRLVLNSGKWELSTLASDGALTTNDGATLFTSLNGLFCDRYDNLYAAASNRGKVYKIIDNGVGKDPTISLVANIGSAYDITVDSLDNIYVAASDSIKKLVFVKDNTPPVAKAGTISGDEDTIISGKLTATDVDGDTLTYSISNTKTAHGTVTITDAKTGAYAYTPDRDYNGEDHFTYEADDGKGGKSQATIDITVNENAIPVAKEGSIPASSRGDRAPQPITSVTSGYTGTLSASDDDGDELAYSIVKQPAHGTVTITDAVKGTYTYTYTSTDNSFVGADSFTYRATDSNGAPSDPATIAILVSKPATSEWFGYYGNQQVEAISKTLQTIREKGLLSQETLSAASQIVSQGATAIKAAFTGTANALQSAFTSFYKSLFG